MSCKTILQNLSQTTKSEHTIRYKDMHVDVYKQKALVSMVMQCMNIRNTIMENQKPMGPVPYRPLIYVLDRSHLLLKDLYGSLIYRDSYDFNYIFQSCSPMYGSEGPMGPVPCMPLSYVWDPSKETFFC